MQSKRYGLEYASAVERNAELLDALRDVITRHQYAHADPSWLGSEAGVHGVQYEAVDRYLNACRWVVPWVNLRCDLADSALLDIGAGSGATSAAFAEISAAVVGYEIDEKSCRAAAERFSVLGVKNATIQHVEPEQLLEKVKSDFPAGAKAVLLFAVLEHLLEAERQLYLREIWHNILQPGGYLIVVDTPNRLGLFDYHTSHLPFYHLLPNEIAIPYARRSPRAEFVEGVHAAGEVARQDVARYRWGVGLSYHDFEVAFGCDSLEGLILANGYEWEITNWFPPNLDDQTMIQYFLDRRIDKDAGFAKSVLNFIFQKPMPGEVPQVRPRLDKAHIHTIVDYHGLDPRLMAWLGVDER